MSQNTGQNILSPTGSPLGDEIDLLELAERGGHNEAATLGLFRRLRGPQNALRGGDGTALRDHLVMTHAPLVEHCARGFMASGEPLEDLVQEGYVGLIKAVDRFDPEKGIKFSTYACHLIAGEIRHYLRDLGRLIHEPGWHFELRQKIARATETLSSRLNRAPSPEEIAANLSVKPETVREVLQRSQTLHVDSLDAQPENDEGDGTSILERHEAQKGGERRGDEARIDDQLFLESALPQLKELEQQAIALFFFEELSKTEIARRMEISVNYVSYLVKRGTENLRRILEATQPVGAGHAAQSELSQATARAAYLLELARGAAQTDPRRTFKPKARVPALSKPGVASLAQFAGWMDEESTRAARYGGEFSTLWCQIVNWADMIAGLSAGEKKIAAAAAAALVRFECREADKVAAMQSADPAGMHFLTLLPATGAPGQSLGYRLVESFAGLEIPLVTLKPEVRIAYATFPLDGKSTDELFGALGKRLSE